MAGGEGGGRLSYYYEGVAIVHPPTAVAGFWALHPKPYMAYGRGIPGHLRCWQPLAHL